MPFKAYLLISFVDKATVVSRPASQGSQDKQKPTFSRELSDLSWCPKRDSFFLRSTSEKHFVTESPIPGTFSRFLPSSRNQPCDCSFEPALFVAHFIKKYPSFSRRICFYQNGAPSGTRTRTPEGRGFWVLRVYHSAIRALCLLVRLSYGKSGKSQKIRFFPFSPNV